MAEMKKKIVALTATVCAAAMMLTGCGGEISNDYITISQYKNVEVEAIEVVEVTDEMLESEIQAMLEGYADYVDVTDRPAQLGDQVTIDYVGTLDGVAFDGGTAEDYLLELGSGTFIEGFEDGIVGHSIGETFDLNLTFPEEYGSAELAGQDVVFTVTLDGITEVVVPEFTDEFVQGISETATTVDEYRAELKTELETYYAENTKEQLMTAAWDVVMENTTVNTYPTEELQELIALYQAEYKSVAEEYGMEFEEFLEQGMGMNEDEFNSQVSTVAKEQMKQTFVAELIIEKENLDDSEEAIDQYYIDYGYVDYYGCADVEEFKTLMEESSDLEMLEDLIRVHIVQEWLGENCKPVEATESSEE